MGGGQQRQRGWVGAVIGMLVVVLSAVGQPAEAHDLPYGYWQCTQATKLASAPVRVGFTNLPVDGTGDGVKNSFRDRGAVATGHLSTVLAANNPTGRGLKWVGQVTSSNTAHIAFRTSTSLPPGALALTGAAGCTTMHAPIKTAFPGSVYIDIAVRSDWFTQDDSRRAYWELCPDRDYAPAYTCSKTIDAGSVMLHELGHAIGLAHPSQTDAHLGGGTTAFTIAKCGVVNDQATMCQAADSGAPQYRTHRRTLEFWDTTSLAFHY